MNFKSLASTLVSEALRVREDEIVEITLTGEKHYFDVLDEFTLMVSKSGAFPTIRLNTPSYRLRYLKEVPERYLSRTPPQVLSRIRFFHRHINIIMDNPDPVFKDVPARKDEAAREAKRPIVEQIQRSNMSKIYLPSSELSDYLKIPLKVLQANLLKGLDIDYACLRKRCKRISGVLRQAREPITIVTGENHSLTFELSDRPVFSEDGSRNLPAGSIFVAPSEKTVNGSILINHAVLKGHQISGLVLSFENGHLTSSSADSNLRLFRQKLKNAYGDKDVFAGFGIGLNPGLIAPLGCEIIDTRVMGSIFIILGSNLIYGGTNFSDMCWALTCMNATVMIGTETLMENGTISTGLL